MFTLREERREIIHLLNLKVMASKTILICLLKKFQIGQVNRVSDNAADTATDFILLSQSPPMQVV